MTWGEIIKLHREKLGWSVADLSIKSGIKHGTIYQIERGQKNGGSIVIIEQLLNTMDVSLCTTSGDPRNMNTK
jgi:transcriptional regulator with XRE-family HTH domain